MVKKTIAKKNERIVVNRDFSIIIPEGYTYSTDKREINGNRQLVFIKTERNEVFDKEYGDFDEYGLDSPFGAPQCMTVMEPRNIGAKLDLSDSDLRARLRQSAEQFITMFGGTIATAKENDDILVYYTKFKGKETSIQFMFFTPENIYNGQIWINDVATQKERSDLAKQWLTSLENYILTDADKVPVGQFVAPSYNESKIWQMGTLTVAVPDQMIHLGDSDNNFGDNLGSALEYNRLINEYAFIAVSKNYEGGFYNCNNAPLSFNCQHSGVVKNPQLAALWINNETIQVDREKTFTDLIKNSMDGAGRGEYPIHYKQLADKLDVVYTKTGEGEDPIEYWCRYFIAFFHNDTIHQVNVFINAQKDNKAFDKAIEDWIDRVKPANEEEIAKYNAMKTTKLLGSLAGENGKIDGVKGTQLFFEDVFFFVKGQLLAKGRHHELKGIQVNAQVIDNYPQIKENLSAFGTALTDLINFVEQDELLVLDEECVHRDFDKLNKIDPMIVNGSPVDVKGAKIGKGLSGARMFLLIAWHMAKIVENEKNSYIVALDGNILRGIPAAKAYICQFIKRLREYNDIADDFSVTFAATLNLEGGMDAMITGINPMHSKSFNDVVSVKKGVSPYESIQKMILTEKANGTWTQWNRGKDGEDNEFEVDFFEGLDAFDSKDSNFETTQTVEKKSVTQKEINKHEESLKKQNESIAELKKIAKENEKLIKEALNKVKETHRSAEREFDKAKAEIERSSSRTISLEYDDVGGRILDAIVGATEASRDLYNSCQSLVLILDTACRPLVTDAVSDSLVNDIYREIQSLNEDSDIDNDYTGTLDDYFLGDLANVHFEPTDDAKQIEKYWRYKCSEQKENNQKIEYLTKNNILEKDIEKHKKYSDACYKLECAKTVKEVKDAQKIFTSLSGYLDSSKLVKKCDEEMPRVAAEEKAAKAEAERIRKEEKRREEEKKNKEKNAKEHMDKVVSECNALVDAFRKELDIALKNHEKDLEDQLRSKCDELKKQKAENEQYLQGLGFFKFAEKKEAKNKNLHLSSEINRLSNPDFLKKEKANAKKAFDDALKNYSAKVKKYLESRFPDLVPKPVKYDFTLDTFLDNNKSRSLTMTQAENEVLKLQILYALTKTSSPKSIPEIVKECDSIKSEQKTSALLRQLREDNMVERHFINGETYFSLAVSKSYVLSKLTVVPQNPTYTEVEKYANKECPQPAKIKSIKLPEIDI